MFKLQFVFALISACFVSLNDASATRYEYEGLADFSLYNTIYGLHHTDYYTNNTVGPNGHFNLSFDENGENIHIDAKLFPQPPLASDPISIEYSSFSFFMDIPQLVFGDAGLTINEATGEFELRFCCAPDTPASFIKFEDSSVGTVKDLHLATFDGHPSLEAVMVNGVLQFHLYKFLVGAVPAADQYFEIGTANAPVKYLGKKEEVPEPSSALLCLLGFPFLRRIRARNKY